MAKSDAEIGANLKRLRGAMSQTELARLMAKRGHRWSQPTVVAVERGERPIRLTEAEDVGQILDSGIFLLLSDGNKLGLTMRYRKVSDVEDRFGNLVQEIFDAQKSLAIGADGRIDDELREMGLRRSPVLIAWEQMVLVIDRWDALEHSVAMIEGSDPEEAGLEELAGLLEHWRSEIQRAAPKRGTDDGEHQTEA
ncbi:helix-turn-helix domain-containing protein [Microbacterium marinilacus]|uniref:HTH cro/C1-type domain-containing protein n=1 Tax=Microbacterium marinilacus TaxID=415209 RepID=A0ABP7BA99_9MICO|nr:helix-turn-helix transcriptional regulator [Microbacterium marinilacus]MBY0687013.1 helix-turn-helix domain-containing protein [Microbacterium marinilacus]